MINLSDISFQTAANSTSATITYTFIFPLLFSLKILEKNKLSIVNKSSSRIAILVALWCFQWPHIQHLLHSALWSRGQECSTGKISLFVLQESLSIHCVWITLKQIDLIIQFSNSTENQSNLIKSNQS